MKKLLVSLSIITILIAGITVAYADGGYIVDYNENLSTSNTAVVDIYLDVNNPEGFTLLNCQIGLYNSSGTNVINNFVSSVSVTPYGNLKTTNLKYLSSQGWLTVACIGTVSNPIIIANNGHLGRFTLTLSQPLTNNLIFGRNPEKDTSYTPVSGGIKGNNIITSSINEYDTISITPSYPICFSNSLSNQNGEIITNDNISDLTKVKLTLSRLHSGAHTGTFLVAFYDTDNKLVYVNSKLHTIDEDTDETEIDIEGDVSSACRIRAFAWDNLSDMEPLCEDLEENLNVE